jgi:hypothetical protein
MAVATLAYDTATIGAVKSFIEKAPAYFPHRRDEEKHDDTCFLSLKTATQFSTSSYLPVCRNRKLSAKIIKNNEIKIKSSENQATLFRPVKYFSFCPATVDLRFIDFLSLSNDFQRYLGVI